MSDADLDALDVQDLVSKVSLSPEDEAFISGEREYLPNFGAGVLYYTDNYFVGLSVPYFLSRGITRNSIAHDFGAYTGVLTGGYKFKVGENFSIIISTN